LCNSLGQISSRNLSINYTLNELSIYLLEINYKGLLHILAWRRMLTIILYVVVGVWRSSMVWGVTRSSVVDTLYEGLCTYIKQTRHSQSNMDV
jgi:hypothetical protein